VKNTLPNSSEKGIYFFDDVKDSELDFSYNIEKYEGVEKPLHSRFNVNVNERVYYGNVDMSYQPPPTSEGCVDFSFRTKDEIESVYKDGNLAPIWFNTLNVNKYGKFSEYFIRGVHKYFIYYFVYVDKAGIRSKPSESISIMPNLLYEKFWIAISLAPIGFNSGIEKVEVYRDINLEYKPVYIGDITPEDEGIFVDRNLTLDPVIYLNDRDTSPTDEHYESGLFWSEPYRPEHIKSDSFMEYGSGDGQQITGLEVLYGNLIIFKENSIYRSALLGAEVPITRTDVISPNIGLIAPNAIVNVDNTLYFLSWEGFYKYDNNVLVRIDLPIYEELQFILNNTDKSLIRDATCGYNPVYDEIWLNIPMSQTNRSYIKTEETGSWIQDNKQRDYGHKEMIQYGDTEENLKYFQRQIYGHIYVFGLSKQYITKFAVQATVEDPRVLLPNAKGYYLKDVVDPRQLIRMYHTNSLGEMRSADIFPSYYGTMSYSDQQDFGYDNAFLHAGIYVETPYSNLWGVPDLSDVDDILNYREIVDLALTNPDARIGAWTRPIMQQVISGALTFPGPRSVEEEPNPVKWTPTDILNRPSTQLSVTTPVRCVFKSKYFTGGTESMIKRVRECNFNIFSKGEISISTRSFPYESFNPNFADERIDDSTGDMSTNILSRGTETFTFSPSISNVHPISGEVITGTGSNILEVVTRSPFLNQSDLREDFYGKPIRFSVEIEASFRTQINSFNFYWRPTFAYLQ